MTLYLPSWAPSHIVGCFNAASSWAEFLSSSESSSREGVPVTKMDNSSMVLNKAIRYGATSRTYVDTENWENINTLPLPH